MDWFPGQWAPIVILDQESVEQLNTMMGEGWVIGKGDARLPLFLFPRRLSQVTGLPAEVQAMFEANGVEELLIAILTTAQEPCEQRAVLTSFPSEHIDYGYVADLIRRSYPDWRNVITISLGSRSALTILERTR